MFWSLNFDFFALVRARVHYLEQQKYKAQSANYKLQVQTNNNLIVTFERHVLMLYCF